MGIIKLFSYYFVVFKIYFSFSLSFYVRVTNFDFGYFYIVFNIYDILFYNIL